MPQSLSKIYIHAVFSTKDRIPVLSDDISSELYDYIGGICKQLGCNPIRIGGYLDHIHILCQLSRTVTVAKLIEEIKTGSSRWLKNKSHLFSGFHWQNGYAVFSVNPQQSESVVTYIDNQKEHHRNKHFADECRIFFREYGIEYDEKYVWD